MAFRLMSIKVIHSANGEKLSVGLSEPDKDATMSVKIDAGKPYQDVTLGEALQLAIAEAHAVTKC